MPFLLRFVLCTFFLACLYGCGTTDSVKEDSNSVVDSILVISNNVSDSERPTVTAQDLEVDAEESILENTLEMGSVAFWDQRSDSRVYLSRSDYGKLSEDVIKSLKPLGLVIELGSQYYIIDRKRKNKDTDWYSAMKNASECHPYDDARWNLPSLSEARQISKVQNDIVYWISRWERDSPSVIFDYNGEYIETFVSDNSSSVFTDVTISNGQIEVNKVQRCDVERAKNNPYSKAYYISKISCSSKSEPVNETLSSSSVNSTTSVQVWKQCMNCFGSGQCPYCYGQGYYHDVHGTHGCPVCTGGKCCTCAGQGGHYDVEYR